VLTNAIAATALTLAATMGSPAAAPLEDEAGFNCATQGNHICGPGGEAPAGLYRDGQLIQPWTNYDNVEADPLYGVTPGTEYDNIAEQVAALHQGCWIEHKVDLPSEVLYGDIALMPGDAEPIPCGQADEALEYGQTFVVEDEFGGTPGGAVCGTDAQCADWSRAHGEEPTGYAAGK
jgi:hypothetical protein